MSANRQIHAAAARVHRIDDPAIERHADELFGTPAAADPTPVEQRDAGPGRVLVEWIGESGPLADQKLAMAEQLGLIPPAIVKAWRTLHERATTRIPGMTHHTMTRERDGMTETVTWGPYNYVQAVTHKDADTLLSGTFGHQFRVIGYTGTQPADMSTIDRFLRPFVPAETTERVEHIVVDDQPTEALSGIVPGTRLGTWTKTR